MKIVVIDTSTFAGVAGLFHDGKLMSEERPTGTMTSAEWLAPAVARLLHAAQGTIDGIAVAHGPGSFTGLRIGVSVAKGVALGLSCPLVGVSSLAILAWGQREKARVVAAIDAHRGEVYAAVFEFAGESYRYLREECAASPLALNKELQGIAGPLCFVGDGATRYADLLCRGLEVPVSWAASSRPEAQSIFELARERLAQGGDDPAVILPHYVRRSDAEIGLGR